MIDLLEEDKTIERLEKIVDDLKTEKRDNVKEYVIKNFQELLNNTTIVLNIGGAMNVLSMYIPTESELSKLLKQTYNSCGYPGFKFEFGGYDLWLHEEFRAWIIRVGAFRGDYSERLEFIKKHVPKFDVSSIDKTLNGCIITRKEVEERIKRCETTLKEIKG